jgi:hypothetical protein
MPRVERDPERGRAAAAKLKALGVKGILIEAAEQGYITQLACKMPECFCPEELGGACYLEPVANEWSDWRSDWMPTLEHFPVSKKEGGKAAVDNAILAHRLCNRLDHSLKGWPFAREGSREDQESPRGRDLPQERPNREHRGRPHLDCGGRGSDAEAEEDEGGAGVEVPD